MDDIEPNNLPNLSDDSWGEVRDVRLLLVAPSSPNEGLHRFLEDEGCDVSRVESLEAGERLADEEAYEIAVVDDRIVDAETESLEGLRSPEGTTVLLRVADYTPESFCRTVELGADTYVRREVGGESTLRLVEQELRARREYDGSAGELSPAGRIVGNSQAMRRVCQLIARTAPSTASTMITGESGAGKELVARALHRLSPRRRRPFVAVNCGAIPENLIESELFGHEEGAFTGATSSRPGRFQQADGGTLLLDEIGELPLDMQVKLLRVLEEQSFERVGGSESVDVDVRILSATNAHLSADVECGDFRRDLYFRLNVLEIDVPPLRDRRNDIDPLWRYFVRQVAAEEARKPLETTPEVRRQLYRYDWPGNVRELRNVAHHSVTMNPEKQIRLVHLPKRFREQLDQKVRDAPHQVRVPGMTLEEIERAAILRTSAWTDSVAETAEMLDISERKVYYKLKEYREEQEPEASEDREMPEEEVDESDGETRRHLVVAEDDVELQSALRELLSDEYQMTIVSTGRELVEEVKCQHPDLVLTDLRMPGLDGIQVLREKHRADWDVPIVLGTAYGSDEIESQAEVLGASAVVEKPFEPARLRRELRRALKAQD